MVDREFLERSITIYREGEGWAGVGGGGLNEKIHKGKIYTNRG